MSRWEEGLQLMSPWQPLQSILVMKEYDILMNKMFLSVNHGEMEKNLVSACTTFIEVFQIKIWYDTWYSNIIYVSFIGEYQIKVQSHEARPFSVSLSRPISCSDPSQCPIFDRIQNDKYTIIWWSLYKAVGDVFKKLPGWL